jgi:hypothetical protein
MIYNELKDIKNEKADLMRRLKGAKNALKKRKPKKKKTLNPVTTSKFMISNNKHLQNNSIYKSGMGASSQNEEPIKKGRGYHMINNFDRANSPNSIRRSSIFRSSIEPNENHFRSHRHGHLYANQGPGNGVSLSLKLMFINFAKL